VRVDVGNPGSVSEGTIEFTCNGERNEMSCCEMKFLHAQMLGMLRGLLPDLPRGSIADVARLTHPLFLGVPCLLHCFLCRP
jgi:hypothetical protein